MKDHDGQSDGETMCNRPGKIGWDYVVELQIKDKFFRQQVAIEEF